MLCGIAALFLSWIVVGAYRPHDRTGHTCTIHISQPTHRLTIFEHTIRHKLRTLSGPTHQSLLNPCLDLSDSRQEALPATNTGVFAHGGHPSRAMLCHDCCITAYYPALAGAYPTCTPGSSRGPLAGADNDTEADNPHQGHFRGTPPPHEPPDTDYLTGRGVHHSPANVAQGLSDTHTAGPAPARSTPNADHHQRLVKNVHQREGPVNPT